MPLSQTELKTLLDGIKKPSLTVKEIKSLLTKFTKSEVSEGTSTRLSANCISPTKRKEVLDLEQQDATRRSEIERGIKVRTESESMKSDEFKPKNTKKNGK